MKTQIKGTELAKTLEEGLKIRIQSLKEQGLTPHLVTILVGEDGASKTYVGRKIQKCKALGVRGTLHHLDARTSQNELESLIQKLSNDPSVHGILLQLPLPASLNAQKALALLAPEKDVDGLNPSNIEKTLMGRDAFKAPFAHPCTAIACMRVLDSLKINLAGKTALVVGRSLLVGRSVASMLLSKNCTLIQAHSHTDNLHKLLPLADIVIACAGVPGLVQGQYLKKNAIVLDVGITRVENPKASKGYDLWGDVDDNAKEGSGFLTPVPGGIGPLTIYALMENLISLSEQRMQTTHSKTQN